MPTSKPRKSTGVPEYLVPRINAMMSSTNCTFEQACSFFGKRGAAKKKQLAELRKTSTWQRQRLHTLALWSPWAKGHESKPISTTLEINDAPSRKEDKDHLSEVGSPLALCDTGVIS